MMTELLWLLLILVNFGGVLLAFRLFGRVGLFFWTAAAVVLANVQVLKTIEIFGMTATMGNVVYGSLFLVTDILSEIYGKNEARKAVYIGFFTLIVATIIMQICLAFPPASSDFIQQSLVEIFGFLPRIAGASLTAYLLSQLHDIWAYALWRKIFPGERRIWIRNNLSTMVSQLLDTVIFCTLAFAGVFTGRVFWSIMVTTYLLKLAAAVLDTPFVYLAAAISRSLGADR